MYPGADKMDNASNDKTVKIALHDNRGFATVDSDFGFLALFNWTVAKGRKTTYARRYIPGQGYELMHHTVLGFVPPNGYVVDHINDDGLDNRRVNLQVLSNSENIRKAYGETAGVRRIARLKSKPWKSELKVKGERVFLGYFSTQEEGIAARVAYLASISKEVSGLDK